VSSLTTPIGYRADGTPIYPYSGGAWNNSTSRTDASALIPEEVSNEMLGKAVETSSVLALFRHIPVARAQVRFPVLSALPAAYWVAGDAGLKQTTEMSWTNKYINIEEIAVIMPVPDNVLDDVDANIWDEAMPLLSEAFARTLDSAVYFGTNAPASFPTNIQAAALAAGNKTTAASANTSGGILNDMDVLYDFVEQDGFEVNGFLAATKVRTRFRQARNSLGDRLSDATTRVGADLRSFDGHTIYYPMRGLWPTATAATSPLIIGGDFTQFVVAVRKDITMKILTEAVIQDGTGAIIFNLAQQDMTAVRLTMRAGWQVVNTINNDNPTENTRYPVAYLGLA
jgi:predicted phage gp36 major capsid-like protein